MPRLITDWTTEDPALAVTLRRIASYPEDSPERLELEAVLHTFQAQWCNVRAGEIRGRRQTSQAISARARRAAQARRDKS